MWWQSSDGNGKGRCVDNDLVAIAIAMAMTMARAMTRARARAMARAMAKADVMEMY